MSGPDCKCPKLRDSQISGHRLTSRPLMKRPLAIVALLYAGGLLLAEVFSTTPADSFCVVAVTGPGGDWFRTRQELPALAAHRLCRLDELGLACGHCFAARFACHTRRPC